MFYENKVFTEPRIKYITEGLSGTKGRFGTIISCKESVQTTVYKIVQKAKCHTSDIHAFYYQIRRKLKLHVLELKM